MARKELKLGIDIDSRDAQKSLRDTAKAARDLGTDIEGSESAGRQVASAFREMADKAELEFLKAQKAAEKLGQALGPELVAKADQGGGGVMGIVLKLQQVGLTLDEVETDADELAAAIKRLDEVNVSIDGVKQSAKKVGEEFDDVSKRTDNTRSVVANFAGNSIQELPGVSSALGPLNMAMGQFGEYASEGNIKLKSFILAGAGLGALSLALDAVGDYMRKIAEQKAFHRDQVDEFTDALRGAGSAAEDLAAHFEEKRKVEMWHEQLGKVVDATAALDRAGLDVQEFTTLIEGGEEAIAAWAEEARLNGDGMEDWGRLVDFVVETARQHTEKYGEAAKRAGIESKFFGEETRDAAGEVKKMGREVEDLTTGMEELRGTLENRDAYDAYIEAQAEMKAAAIEAWTAAEEGAEDSAEKQIAYEESVRGSIEATMDYITSLGDVPAEKVTNIQALIDEGKLAEAEAQLTILARNRTVELEIEARGGAGYGGGGRVGPGGRIIAGATGGIVTRPTMALIGEDGPEAVVPLNRAPGASPLPGRVGAAMNITINMPPGSNGRDVVEAIKRYERQHGRVF